MLQYSPKIITDSLVMCLDASNNKSYPAADLPVKGGLALWLDAADDTTFSYSSGTSVSQWRDESGSNFHASQATVGSQPSRSTFQNSRKTVTFDGTNDTVTIPNFTCNSEMSIFVVSNCGNTLFIEQTNDINSYTAGFYIYGYGEGMFFVKRNSTYSYSSLTNWLVGGFNIASGVNSTGLDLLAYKNGSQQTPTYDGRTSLSNSYFTNTLYIGSRGASSIWSSGPIAEIIIYNRKVTDTERKQIHTYLGQKWGISNTDRSIVDLAGNDDNGLFGDGTVSNMPVYNYYNKGGLRFNSSFSNYVISPNTTISGSQTFSVWAVMTGKQNSPTGVLSQHDYASTANFGINIITSNQLAPSIGYTNGTREYQDKPTTATISYNQIFNAVLVYNAGLNKIYWYINGVFDSEYSLSLTPKSTNWPIGLGRWDPSYNNYYFDGTIFSALVYNKALSAAEVAQNYEAQKSKFANTIVQQGLVLNLDAGNPYSYAGAGSAWYDVSGNNLIFNSQGATQTPFTTIGGSPCFDFNGSGYWECGTNFNLVDLGGDCTIIMWFYCETMAQRRTIFEKADTSYASYQQEIAVTWEVGNDFSYYSRFSPSYDYANTAASTVNAWNMVGIKMSTGKTTAARTGFYSKNGSAWSASYNSESNVALVAAGAIRIGGGYAGTVTDGYIGSVLCYNRMLTDAEILQNYNATKGRFGL